MGSSMSANTSKDTGNLTDKKLRIMINTNSIWTPSGYGAQAKQFLPLIAKEGYPTACVAFYGLEGGLLNVDNILFYPKLGATYGDDAMVKHGEHYKADVMFTLQDIWTISPNALKALAERKIRWIPIVPIDHEPCPPPIFDRLKLAYRIVTYAPFGHEELKRCGMHSTYIPHTVECDVFKKITSEQKTEHKKQLGIPDDFFVFGMVAANKDNPPRKSFNHVMDAFAHIHKKYPKTAMYFHTNIDQQGGFPIREYSKALGIDKLIYFPDPYELLFHIDSAQMAKVYGIMDTLLSPSMNEGFGVPVIEAASCEVPALVTDFTAMRDTVIDGKTGYKINVMEKRWSPLNSWVAVPDTRDLIEKMEKMILMDKKDKEAMGKAARELVCENYDLPVVFEKHWKPFLSKLETEIYKDKN